MKTFILPFLLLVFAAMISQGCARRTLVVRVPEGAGSQWGEAAAAINYSAGILKQLEDEPDNISIAIDRPPDAYSDKGDLQGAF